MSAAGVGGQLPVAGERAQGFSPGTSCEWRGEIMHKNIRTQLHSTAGIAPYREMKLANHLMRVGSTRPRASRLRPSRSGLFPIDTRFQSSCPERWSRDLSIPCIPARPVDSRTVWVQKDVPQTEGTSFLEAATRDGSRVRHTVMVADEGREVVRPHGRASSWHSGVVTEGRAFTWGDRNVWQAGTWRRGRPAGAKGGCGKARRGQGRHAGSRGFAHDGRDARWAVWGCGCGEHGTLGVGERARRLTLVRVGATW